MTITISSWRAVVTSSEKHFMDIRIRIDIATAIVIRRGVMAIIMIFRIVSPICCIVA